MALYEWPCPRCGTAQKARCYSQAEADSTVGRACAACQDQFRLLEEEEAEADEGRPPRKARR